MGTKRGKLDWRWEQLNLWCRCGEYMKGDGHGLCPRCADESESVGADLIWIDGSNICRGQE